MVPWQRTPSVPPKFLIISLWISRIFSEVRIMISTKERVALLLLACGAKGPSSLAAQAKRIFHSQRRIICTLLPRSGRRTPAHIANPPSRSARSPVAAWEQGRRRQILGRGGLRRRRWAGDLRGGFLPALVRCRHEQVDIDAGRHSAKIEIWSLLGVDGICDAQYAYSYVSMAPS